MKEITGSLWQIEAQTKVIMTNGIVNSDGLAVMGAGTALQASQKWPGLRALLGNRIKKYGNIVHVFQVPMNYIRQDLGCVYLVAMPTKYDFKKPSDLTLIAESLVRLRWLADPLDWTNVLLPEPGTGLGQLSWQDVQPYVAKLDDRFTVVHKG